MAIVKNPGLSLQASGNVCGVNFTRWRGLAILRCAWTGTVPNTTKQVVMQGFMTAVSQAWGGTLSAADRQTWVNRARTVIWRSRFGDPYIPNGYQLFMKWNIRRKVMALSIMTIAPGVQELVYVDYLEVKAQLGALRIFMILVKEEDITIESYGVEFYRAGPYDSGGRRPIEGEWLFLDREVPPAIYFDYDVILNKWYWYRGRQVAEFGDVGNWFQVQQQMV